MVHGSPEDTDGLGSVSLRGWVARALFVLPFALVPLWTSTAPGELGRSFEPEVTVNGATDAPGEPRDHTGDACAMFRSALRQFDADGAGRAPRRLGEAAEVARRAGDRDLAIALQEVRLYVDAVVAPGAPDRDAQAAFGRGYAYVDEVCRPPVD